MLCACVCCVLGGGEGADCIVQCVMPRLYTNSGIDECCGDSLLPVGVIMMWNF